MKITTTLSLSFLLSASYLPAAFAQTIERTLNLAHTTAHRGEADRKLFCQPGDMQLLAGQQPGREDIGPQPFLNGRRQASRPVAGQIVPKTQPDTAHCEADWRAKPVSSIENRFFAGSAHCAI